MKFTRVKVRRRPHREPWRPGDWPPFWKFARWVGAGLILAAFVLGVSGIADTWYTTAQAGGGANPHYVPNFPTSYVIVMAEVPDQAIQSWQVTLTRDDPDGAGSIHTSGSWGANQAHVYVPPGRYRLRLQPPHQFSPPPAPVHVFEGTSTAVTVSLTPPGALGGRILDESGRPVSGATVVRPPPPDSDFDPDTAVTDERGIYHFPTLGTEALLNLVVEASDQTLSVTGVRLIPGGACRLNVRTGPAARVAGLVPERVPTPATVQLAPLRVNRAGRVQTLDGDRAFEFVHPPDQSCLVMAHGTSPDGAVQVATATVGKAAQGETETVADWSLTDGTIEWSLSDRMGTLAPSGVTLRWESATSGAWWETRVEPGDDGIHRVVGLPAGRVTFRFARSTAAHVHLTQTLDYDGGDATIRWEQ